MSDTGTTGTNPPSRNNQLQQSAGMTNAEFARLGTLRSVSQAQGGAISRDLWQTTMDAARQGIRQDSNLFWQDAYHKTAWFELSGLAPFFKRLQSQGLVDSNWVPYNSEVVDPMIFAEMNRLGVMLPEGGDAGGYGYGGASTAERIENMMANMRAMGLAWNVEIDDTKLRQMATTAVNGEYNQQQAMNLIGQHVVATAGASDKVLQGQLGQWYKQQANAYGLQMSDASIKASLNQWVQGLQSQESIQAQLLQKSKALYPHLADRFDNGETFEQIIDPYREYAAQLLEKDPNQLSFVNSELAKAVAYNPDGKGNRTMTISEFGEYVRSTSSLGYQYTNRAISDASLIGEALTKMFGRV